MRIRKAVFPVAGLGTRFLPATKVLPKEMLPILNKPMVQYAVEEAMTAGIEEFIFVTGRGKYTIEDHFDISYELEQILESTNKTDRLSLIRSGIPEVGKAFFTRQQRPLGLGHAVLCAKQFIGDEPFAVLLSDDFMIATPPVLKQMVDAYASYPYSMMAAVEEVPLERISSYGVLGIASSPSPRIVQASSLVEKPPADKAPSSLAIVGRYILPPSIFSTLEHVSSGALGEIQLTDGLMALMNNTPFYGYRFEGQRFDCGNKVGFLEANIALAMADIDMRSHLLVLFQKYLKE